MALYKDGNPVSGLNSIPRLTLTQYNALNVKPEFWVRTDAPESYKKLSADQVSYDSNNTVKDMLDTKSSIHLITGLTTPQSTEGTIYTGFSDDIVLGVYVYVYGQYRNINFGQGEDGTIYALNLTSTYQNKPCIICSAKLS